MRRDAAAVQRRRQRALDRAPVPPPEPPAEPKYRTPDTVEGMLDFAAELGWEWISTTSGYQFRHPSGLTAALHLTTSDKAAWRNLRCRLLKPVREERRTTR